MKRWTAAAAGLLSLVLVVGVAPAAAQAAEVTGITAYNSNGENPGLIHVALRAAEQVREIHAQFLDPATGDVA